MSARFTCSSTSQERLMHEANKDCDITRQLYIKEEQVSTGKDIIEMANFGI